ncbi:MAG TPA: NAD(P)/FAD-dependent oxidoreductase [Vicinamibacterales bacterium]|nr:NAD(P)/FAD-dependent oxidoreductase [Vicinamibacterales bacterium]
MSTQRPRVVIIGGGFGGLKAAQALKRAPVSITLIDRRNHHVFQPLLYQVATAGLSPGDIAAPIRWILRRQRNVRVLLAEARRIDVSGRMVHLDEGTLSYDYLIVATGATHAYFGHPEWAAHAPGLKTLDDALEIRRRMLLAYERAERETDPAEQRRLLTFVVVGGGPTGVEMAGAMAEIARQTLADEFRSISTPQARVILVEAGPTILSTFPPDLRAKARRSLEALKVEVREGAPVTHIDECGVEIGGERIEARTVIWAAGVAASPLAQSLGVPLDRAGRVPVTPELTLPGHPEVFVIGDLATLAGPDGKPLPGVAPVAQQQAVHAARNIRRLIDGKPLRPFRYRNYGSLATIGRASAIADFGWIHLSGYLGWLVWLFVHIIKLIGFRNRLLVLIQWAGAYLTYQRSVRLITGSWEPPRPQRT